METEYRTGRLNSYPESVDYMEVPKARQRALSVASVLTNTMDGGYSPQTPQTPA